MAVRTLRVNVPERLYLRLEAQAQATQHTVGEIVLQRLAREAPPIEDDLAPSLRAELAVMEHLSDPALWQIAQSTMNSDEVALYDLLLERHQNNELTPEGQQWLARLRDQADALMVRKAHAYALLKSRGRVLPSLDQLHAQIQ